MLSDVHRLVHKATPVFQYQWNSALKPRELGCIHSTGAACSACYENSVSTIALRSPRPTGAEASAALSARMSDSTSNRPRARNATGSSVSAESPGASRPNGMSVRTPWYIVWCAGSSERFATNTNSKANGKISEGWYRIVGVADTHGIGLSPSSADRQTRWVEVGTLILTSPLGQALQHPAHNGRETSVHVQSLSAMLRA